MQIYSNNTQYSAIVTVEITAGENLQEAVQVGLDVMKTAKAILGQNDFLVEGGSHLELMDGVTGKVVAVRNAP